MHAMNKLLNNTPSVVTTNPAGGTRSASKILVRNLNFYYGRYKALHDISLEVPERRVTAFIGPSGCGKSTLLRAFNRIYNLYHGQRAEGDHDGHVLPRVQGVHGQEEGDALVALVYQLDPGQLAALEGRGEQVRVVRAILLRMNLLMMRN